MKVQPPHVDGEKIPPTEFGDIFRPPPGVDEVRRNTLLIGARGAGKTTLLLHLSTQEPGAWYISLVDILGGIAKDFIFDSVSEVERKEEEEKQKSKAIRVLLLWLIREAAARDRLPPIEEMQTVFPEFLRLSSSEGWEHWLNRMEGMIPNTYSEPTLWPSIKLSGVFRRACQLVGTEYNKHGQRLQFLFDRADALPTSCVLPVLELLDQDGAYLTLIATRPAPNADLDWGNQAAIGLMPHDQYDVVPLGHAPRSPEWRNFVKAAISAQLPQALDSKRLPDEGLNSIVYFAGDSVRLALQITHRVLKGEAAAWRTSLVTALRAASNEMVNRVEPRVRQWQPRFRSTREHWRSMILEHTGRESVQTPVLFDLKVNREDMYLDNLAPPQTALDRFVAACLQDSVLRPRHGQYWYPGKRFREVEVNPLLVWEKRDGITYIPGKRVKIPVSGGLFMGGGGQPATVRSGQMFVALRFNFPQSMEFYRKLRNTLSNHPMLGKIQLRTGHLPDGVLWAESIRDLIRKCTLPTIGDATGTRSDIIFELGIAYGLDRTIIPVVESAAAIQDCPFWLTARNVGVYDSLAGINRLTTSIYDFVYRGQRDGREKLPATVPHVCGLIGADAPWGNHLDELAFLAQRESVNVEALPRVNSSNYDSALQLVARSSLLVLTLENTASDSFAYFASGILIARPNAGFGKMLRRKIILIPTHGAIDIPESLLRCQNTVFVANSAKEFATEVKAFLAEYSRWRGSPAEGLGK